MGDFPCTAKGAHGAFQADCDSAYAGVGTQFKCGAFGGGTGTGGDHGAHKRFLSGRSGASI